VQRAGRDGLAAHQRGVGAALHGRAEPAGRPRGEPGKTLLAETGAEPGSVKLGWLRSGEQVSSDMAIPVGAWAVGPRRDHTGRSRLGHELISTPNTLTARPAVTGRSAPSVSDR
jgi:hypothetical protein